MLGNWQGRAKEFGHYKVFYVKKHVGQEGDEREKTDQDLSMELGCILYTGGII